MCDVCWPITSLTGQDRFSPLPKTNGPKFQVLMSHAQVQRVCVCVCVCGSNSVKGFDCPEQVLPLTKYQPIPLLRWHCQSHTVQSSHVIYCDSPLSPSSYTSLSYSTLLLSLYLSRDSFLWALNRQTVNGLAVED